MYKQQEIEEIHAQQIKQLTKALNAIINIEINVMPYANINVAKTIAIEALNGGHE